MAGTDKRQQSLYFPEDMLREIQEEANRQDRSLSWIVQQAWKIARNEIMRFPSVNDVIGGEARPPAPVTGAEEHVGQRRPQAEPLFSGGHAERDSAASTAPRSFAVLGRAAGLEDLEDRIEEDSVAERHARRRSRRCAAVARSARTGALSGASFLRQSLVIERSYVHARKGRGAPAPQGRSAADGWRGAPAQAARSREARRPDPGSEAPRSR